MAYANLKVEGDVWATDETNNGGDGYNGAWGSIIAGYLDHAQISPA